MKILIADDDPIGRTIVQRIVARGTHQAIEATDGAHALTVLERDDPDVLITDVRMPVMDGFELISAVRGSQRFRDMPIICLSAVNDRDAILHLAALGINEYLLKPVRPRELSDRLEQVAAKHGAWKVARESAEPGATNAVTYVVDPNPESRSHLVAAIASNFTVVELESSRACLAHVHATSVPPSAVLLSKGLGLFGETQLAAVLRRLAAERNWRSPAVILLEESSDTPSSREPFDAVVDRADVAGVIAAAQRVPVLNRR